ncbi:hypothetical protein [Flavihumibacter sp.]|uniref:hypothetical protein n=1 Tax=Flavihumibacter sp. TaxID=1913981 RepID=UPI002FC8417A|nr:hypothetical protein [Flavihumibacter sediminis]
MKKILLTAFAAMGILFARSQDTTMHSSHHDSSKMAQKEAAKMQHEKDMDAIYVKIGLDDSKKQQVKAINDEFYAKAKSLKKDESLDKDARKEQYKTLLKDRNAKLEAILGAEKWKELEKEIKDYRKAKGWEDEDDMMEKKDDNKKYKKDN